MADQENQVGEARSEERRTEEEPAQLAREQARRKDTVAREQVIEEDQEARKLMAKKQTRE